MIYQVAPGDSLWSIARRKLGDGHRWIEIADDNHLVHPGHLLVGQQLRIRGSLDLIPIRPATQTDPVIHGGPQAGGSARGSAMVPGFNYLIVLADEINPLTRKVVRRVLVNAAMTAEASKKLGRPLSLFPHPERFGFIPSGPTSAVSMGRHAMNMKPSPFVSASDRALGATRFKGEPFWIDVDKARAAGATLHETEEILRDLDRIAAKLKPEAAQRIEAIKKLVMADREVLLKGAVPATAVKGMGAMALTRGLQCLQIIGFAVTAYQLGKATAQSVHEHSARPIAAETIRQAGGWAAAVAGMKIGAAAGAAVGIETGPGAILTGAAGAVIFGSLGYFGFDWIADHVHPN